MQANNYNKDIGTSDLGTLRKMRKRFNKGIKSYTKAIREECIHEVVRQQGLAESQAIKLEFDTLSDLFTGTYTNETGVGETTDPQPSLGT